MEYKKLKFRSLGTNIELSLLSKNPDQVLNLLKNKIEYYHLIFSMFDAKSELYKVNQCAKISPFKVSDDLFELVHLGKSLSLTSPSVNIAMGKLSLYYQDIKNYKKPLDKAEIASLLEDANPKHIKFSDKSIYLEKDLKIDLGSLAKGYISDKLVEILKKEEVKSALLNLGGNIYCHGFNFQRTDLSWKIGIQKAFSKRDDHVLSLKLNDMALVTSGIFERYFVNENGFYHHILSPKDGYPIKSDMDSISVICQKALDGEVWTSKLFGLSIEDLERISNENKLALVAQYKDQVYVSKSCKKYLVGGEYD